MLPKISIDLSDLAEEFSLKAEQTQELGSNIVNSITDRIYQNWLSCAKNELKSTRKIYINSLNIGNISPLQKYIILNGPLPNMIENGAGAFDMKLAFSKSSKKINKKNGGWFLTVPFRHATPNALGESEIFSGVMPKGIYNIAKKLSPKITQIGVGSVNNKPPENLGKNLIPKNLDNKLTRPSVTNYQSRETFDEYTHKSSIYQGMIRNQTTYEKSTSSSYITFRRVSDRSDINSWVNRGIIAHNFAKKALAKTDIDNIINRITDDYLDNL